MAAKKKTTTAKKSAPKKKPVKAAKKPAARKPVAKAPAKKRVAAKSPAKKSAAGSKKKAPARKGPRVAKRPTLKRKPAPKKRVAAKAPAAPLPEAKVALELAREVARVAADKKAERILIIDTRARASAVGYDYLVLASGEADRQLAAIQEGVDQLFKPRGIRAASVEASPEWVCATWDEGVIAHFFTADRREEMDLEGLWRDAPRVLP